MIYLIKLKWASSDKDWKHLVSHLSRATWICGRMSKLKVNRLRFQTGSVKNKLCKLGKGYTQVILKFFLDLKFMIILIKGDMKGKCH